MYKKDMIWVATASLIHPNVVPTYLVTVAQINAEIKRLFNTTVTQIQLTRHLVSWKARDANSLHPEVGGDRSRYLFQTSNGLVPSGTGNYRLYKAIDAPHDGKDKTGTTYPNKTDILPQYRYLVDWYLNNYY